MTKSYDEANTSITYNNGMAYKDQQPFSGHLYRLNQQHQDTISSIYYSEGKKDGIGKKWYPNGQLQEIRSFCDGFKTGIHKGYWPNGNKRFCYQFEQGDYEGRQYQWFESGKLYQLKNYHNGQEAGMQQEWNEKGKLVINYEAYNGRQYGNIGKKNCASIWRNDVYTKPTH